MRNERCITGEFYLQRLCLVRSVEVECIKNSRLISFNSRKSQKTFDEIICWKYKWKKQPLLEPSATALYTVLYCDKDFYPTIHTLLKIFCTLLEQEFFLFPSPDQYITSKNDATTQIRLFSGYFHDKSTNSWKRLFLI